MSKNKIVIYFYAYLKVQNVKEKLLENLIDQVRQI